MGESEATASCIPAGSDEGGHPPMDYITIREPCRGWFSFDLHEVWRYRELLQLFIWRNTVVRYKQSVVGIGWAVIKPVTSMAIFSIIFGRVAKLPSEGLPYPILTFVALLPWQYCAGCLSEASSSLVNNASIAKKVYFPRLILPLSSLFTNLVDFGISFVVLLGMMVWYHEHIMLTWGVFCLPFFMLLAMLTPFAVSLWFASFMVKYRDVRHLLPYVTRVWMYVSPVAYSSTLVPEKWRLVYGLNPMAGVVDGFRWALLGKSAPDWLAMLSSVGVMVLVLLGGLAYFRRIERSYVDIV